MTEKKIDFVFDLDKYLKFQEEVEDGKHENVIDGNCGFFIDELDMYFKCPGKWQVRFNTTSAKNGKNQCFLTASYAKYDARIDLAAKYIEEKVK